MTEQQTPDREKTIAEIREALENVTPGDWYTQQRYANLWSIEVKQDGRYPITIANVTTTLLEVGIHDEQLNIMLSFLRKRRNGSVSSCPNWRGWNANTPKNAPHITRM